MAGGDPRLVTILENNDIDKVYDISNLKKS